MEVKGNVIAPSWFGTGGGFDAAAGLGPKGNGAGAGMDFSSRWNLGLAGRAGEFCCSTAGFFRNFENRPNISPPLQAHHAPFNLESLLGSIIETLINWCMFTGP